MNNNKILATERYLDKSQQLLELEKLKYEISKTKEKKGSNKNSEDGSELKHLRQENATLVKQVVQLEQELINVKRHHHHHDTDKQTTPNEIKVLKEELALTLEKLKEEKSEKTKLCTEHKLETEKHLKIIQELKDELNKVKKIGQQMINSVEKVDQEGTTSIKETIVTKTATTTPHHHHNHNQSRISNIFSANSNKTNLFGRKSIVAYTSPLKNTDSRIPVPIEYNNNNNDYKRRGETIMKTNDDNVNSAPLSSQSSLLSSSSSSLSSSFKFTCKSNKEGSVDTSVSGSSNSTMEFGSPRRKTEGSTLLGGKKLFDSSSFHNSSVSTTTGTNTSTTTTSNRNINNFNHMSGGIKNIRNTEVGKVSLGPPKINITKSTNTNNNNKTGIEKETEQRRYGDTIGDITTTTNINEGEDEDNGDKRLVKRSRFNLQTRQSTTRLASIKNLFDSPEKFSRSSKSSIVGGSKSLMINTPKKSTSTSLFSTTPFMNRVLNKNNNNNTNNNNNNLNKELKRKRIDFDEEDDELKQKKDIFSNSSFSSLNPNNRNNNNNNMGGGSGHMEKKRSLKRKLIGNKKIVDIELLNQEEEED